MKYIKFSKISIKNFLSVGDVPITIEFKQGLNIITGINKDKVDRRNGVGKTTIADGIFFSLFGNTLRDLPKERIIHNLTYNTTEVSIWFSIEENNSIKNVQVVRTLNPSACYIFIDGQDVTRDTIINTNLYIQKLISGTPDIFKNCVILTVNETTPFSAQKKVEKRKFIEGIFNLEIFSDMLKQARGEYNEVQGSLNVTVARHEEATKFERQQKQIFDNSKEARLEKIKSLNSTYKKNIEIIESNSKRITKVEANILTEAENIISKLKNGIVEGNEKINTLRNNIAEVKAIKTVKQNILTKINVTDSNCSVCLQPISEHVKCNAEQEITNITKEIQELDAKDAQFTTKKKSLEQIVKQLQTNLDKQKLLINNYHDRIKENESLTCQIDQLNVWNESILKDIESLNNQAEQNDIQLQDIVQRIITIKQEIEALRSKIAIIDTVKFIVSEEGVKSFIVKKLLALFNNRIQYYLNKLESRFVCTFNEYFEEEIVNSKNKICSYFNLSGAERKDIDFACLFAFMDMRRIQGNVVYNLCAFDELFDTSLDERGIELILNVLRERVEQYNECIYLISHRKESIKSATGEIIFLQKENDITTRVDISETLINYL